MLHFHRFVVFFNFVFLVALVLYSSKAITGVLVVVVFVAEAAQGLNNLL